MNEPGNENVRIGGVADELEQNPEVPVSEENNNAQQ